MKICINNIICISIIVIIILGYILYYVKKRGLIEEFTWSDKSIHKFLRFQDTINYNTQFNMQMIQEQASEEELQQLLDNGYWPWSKETEKAYLSNISHNTMLKMDPYASMETDKTIYNERAMQQLLGWNTKEGRFLLNGTLNGNETIKCNTNNEGNTLLQKKIFKGYNNWNGYSNYETTDITNENIPKEVPGFRFINNVCNPCVALDNDYTCPFQINTKKEGDKISTVWRRLWNV